MLKNNRPEGWKNPYNGEAIRLPDKEGKTFKDGKLLTRERIWEAGADAMLEGLKKGATKVNNIGDLPQGKGVIVFIPD